MVRTPGRRTTPRGSGSRGATAAPKPWWKGTGAKILAICAIIGTIAGAISNSEKLVRTVMGWLDIETITLEQVTPQLDALRNSTSSDDPAARAQLEEWRLSPALDSLVVSDLSAYVSGQRPRSQECRSTLSPADVAASGGITAALQDVIEFAGEIAHRERRHFFQRMLRVQPSKHFSVELSRADLRGMTHVLRDPAARVVETLDLRGARLDSACLADVRLHYAKLDSVNLSGADLLGADLTSSSMVGTIFDFAKMPNANLTFANLRCAKLGAVDLSGADFSRASLEWAFLGGATLNGIKHLSEARRLDSAYLVDVSGLSNGDRATAAAKGAITTPRDQAEWTSRAMSQVLPDSICSRPPVAGDSPGTR